MHRRTLLTGIVSSIAAPLIPATQQSYIAPTHRSCDPCLLTADDELKLVKLYSNVQAASDQWMAVLSYRG